LWEERLSHNAGGAVREEGANGVLKGAVVLKGSPCSLCRFSNADALLYLRDSIRIGLANFGANYRISHRLYGECANIFYYAARTGRRHSLALRIAMKIAL
jgi:hypothetical protein